MNWLWTIEPESDTAPFGGFWPRGAGKGAELGAAELGVLGKRSYVLYVGDTQDHADDSVQNIGGLLASATVARRYPDHSKPRVNKLGDRSGWRPNRLRTADGFTVDASGIDLAGRGVKLDNQRPDVIVFDGIDRCHDSPHQTAKKIASLTDSLLAAETDNAAVISIQNLIIHNGVASSLPPVALTSCRA